jgi:hypothetical protein
MRSRGCSLPSSFLWWLLKPRYFRARGFEARRPVRANVFKRWHGTAGLWRGRAFFSVTWKGKDLARSGTRYTRLYGHLCKARAEHLMRISRINLVKHTARSRLKCVLSQGRYRSRRSPCSGERGLSENSGFGRMLRTAVRGHTGSMLL